MIDRIAGGQTLRATLARQVRCAVLVLWSGLLAGGCGQNSDNNAPIQANPSTGAPVTAALGLRLVAAGFTSPTFITHAGDDQLFVVEQPGRIRLVQDGRLEALAFLDIVSLVGSGGERGLLSAAFHPDYSTPGAAGAGLLWVNYTDRNGDTVVARYAVSDANPNVADPASARILLRLAQPFANHNGGQLQFGPVEGAAQKRYLYIGMGDGGGGGDPLNNAQSNTSLLGKMLRLDPSLEVAAAPPFYSIPPDNPNAGAGVLLGTVWARGLRNPWRFSFDADRGDLYLADVGQNRWEEVHVTPAGTPGGQNYGWPILEGRECFQVSSGCDQRGLELPVFVYAQTSTPRRCAIIGGYVYRGRSFPELSGIYLYADLCSGEIWGLQETLPGNWAARLLHTAPFSPTTFGEDVHHELYIGGGDGRVYQLVFE